MMERADNVQAFLKSFLARKFAQEGRGDLPELDNGSDLMMSGLIDSLGLLELVTAMSRHFGREIDLDGLDAEQLTIVGPLCSYISSLINRTE
jgi:acyl carrier protein